MTTLQHFRSDGTLSASTSGMDLDHDCIRALAKELASALPQQLPLLNATGIQGKTVADMSDAALGYHQQSSANTQRSVNSHWRSIVAKSGNVQLASVTLDDVGWIVTAPGARSKLYQFKLGYRIAQALGWACAPNPLAMSRVPWRPKRSVGCTPAEGQAVFAAAVQSIRTRSRHWRAAGVALAQVTCGIRGQEAHMLRWADLDLDAGIMWLRGGKGRQRPCVLSQVFRELLELFPSRGQHECLFPANKGSGHVTDVYEGWSSLVKLAGIRRPPGRSLRMHDLRHWFGLVSCEQTEIECTREQLGHLSERQTAHYAGRSMKKAKRAVDATDRVLRKAVA